MTDNYLSIVSTVMESLESTHNNRKQVVVVIINIYIEQEHSTNILWDPLWQPRERFPNPNMVHDIHENTC